jgi:2-methylcitrate synthase
MCFGKVPPPEVVKAFDISLILYAEHSFNASTFTARVITSSRSDIYSAVTGGICSLKGPLHGGANEAVMLMMLEIGDPAKAERWMRTAIAKKKLIMGFGHRVYKWGDSRVPTMRACLDVLAAWKGDDNLTRMSDGLQKVMLEEKNIHPNLDFPAGPAYYLMGFDIDMFTPIFVMSRITGWVAHYLEQNASNKLIRPLSGYNGRAQRKVKAIAKRETIDPRRLHASEESQGLGVAGDGGDVRKRVSGPPPAGEADRGRTRASCRRANTGRV